MKKYELEQKFPQNHIITDRAEKVSVMVCIKKFYLDDVMDGALHIPHPAFIVNKKEIDRIYISKFQNVIVDGLAYSLPDQDPSTHINFDAAVKACISKGNGFHLMTAMEWGAIALLCQKSGWLPYGNNDMGKDYRERKTIAKIAYFNQERSICRTATGTGPMEWSHNRQPNGIYDLNANVWEWVGGLRLVYGELQVLPDNNAASERYDQSASSQAWRAIDAETGAWLSPDGNGTTPNSIKLDFVNDRWLYTGQALTSIDEHARYCSFADVTTNASIGEMAKLLLHSLGILPSSTDQSREVFFYANNGKSERIAFRGGRWGQGQNSGIFKTCFDDPRSYSGDAVGFRSAYYEQ